MKLSKQRLQEIAGINESKVTIDDKDGEILLVALKLAHQTMTRNLSLSADQKQRLDKLMDDFSIAYGDGQPYTDTSSPVDAMAAQLDRR